MADLQQAQDVQRRLLDATGETFTPEGLSAEENRALRLEATDTPTLGATLGAAIEQNWLGVHWLRMEGQERFTPDPDFRISTLPADKKSQLLDGIEPELIDEYGAAVNFDHAMAIRQRILKAKELQATLDKAGMGGAAAGIGAAILDPVTVVTGGLGAKGLQVWRAGRAAKIAAGAIGASGASAAGTALREYGNPLIDDQDVALSAALGLLLGGAGGAVSRTAAQVSGKALVEVGAIGAADAVKRDLMGTVWSRLRGDPEVESGFPAEGSQSVGAAVSSSITNAVKAGDANLIARAEAEAPDPRTVTGDLGSMYSQVVRSGNKVAGFVASKLMPNPVGVGFQSPTAYEEATNLRHTLTIRSQRAYKSAYREWAEGQGLGLFKRHGFEAADRFAEEVGIAVRTGDASDPAVARAADEIRNVHRDVLRFAKEAGVEGFENVEENANYLMRRWRLDRIHAAERMMGKPGLRRFLGDALVRGSAGRVDADRAYTIADVVLDTVVKGKYGIDDKVGGDTMRKAVDYAKDQLKTRLGDAFPEGEELIEEALTGLFRSGKADTSTRSKFRVRFDEGHSTPIYGADGQPSGTFRFTDLIENNAALLTSDYLREMSGRIGLARQGLESEASWQKAMDTARAAASGQEGTNMAALEEHLDTLNLFRNATLGRPLRAGKDFPKLRRAARLMRNYNFARVMGMVGLAQWSELGNVLGTAGWRATLKHVPALRQIMKRAKSGQLSDAFQRELEDAVGIGADDLLHDPFGRVDEFGAIEEARWRGVDRKMAKVNEAVANWSLMTPTTNALERLAARAMTQHLADMAAGRIKGLNPERLKALGLEGDMLGRVLDHLKPTSAGGKVELLEGGVSGAKVNRLNLDQWDSDVSYAFRMAMQRYVRRAIQKNDPGDLFKFMTTDMGKLIFQFRTFAAVSFAKQLVHGVRHHDIHTFNSFLTAMLLGGLSYTATVYASGVARGDSEKYLGERLTPAEVAKGAFYRAGFSSLLPQIADTLLYTGGYDPMFAHTRSTGLSTQLIWGNPTFDLMDSAMRTARSIATGKISEGEEFRRATRILAFQNAFGFAQALDAVGAQLDD